MSFVETLPAQPANNFPSCIVTDIALLCFAGKSGNSGELFWRKICRLLSAEMFYIHEPGRKQNLHPGEMLQSIGYMYQDITL